ncbi:MAG: TonB-dependent receptor domain-containing protein [Acidobacteriota bacterium]
MLNLRRLGCLIGLIGLCTFMIQDRAQAQVLYGSLTGNVSDSSGAAVPGADVSVVNPATNFAQTGITDEAGVYLIRNIPKGTYTLKVTLPGFKEFVDDNVAVTVGSITRRNVVLEVGQLTEVITVSGAATVLQTETSDVHVQLESKEISDLPLNQYRNYQALINLVPGATPGRFQNAITDTPGRALTHNINGTARNNNNTRIDGAQSVNIWLPHHTAYVPPAETIEVVNISTNNFDAETGFAGGAAVTVVTKSGTNELHGSAFGYHENSALNARDFFNLADTDGDGKADKPGGNRNIDGFTVGGPIMKDKLFFFGGWEGTFQRLPKTDLLDVATADQRRGDFSAFLPGNPNGFDETIIYDPLTGNPDATGREPFPNNIIPEDRLSPPAVKMAGFLPLPNLSGIDDNYGVSGTEAMDRHNIDIKMDWYRSQQHSIWGKFSWLDAEVAKNSRFGKQGGGGAIGGGGDGVGLTDVRVWGIGHTLTLSPTFLIDGNLGFTDMDQQVLSADIDLGNFAQDVLGFPGANAAPGQEQACIVEGFNRCGGIPRFDVSGFNSFGQLDGWTPIFRDENSLTFTHSFSWTKDNHEVRWGYDLVKHMLDHWQPEIGGNGPRGRIRFSGGMTDLIGDDVAATEQNAWAAFMLGLPREMGKNLQWELMTANEWQHALYLRDRWQVTPKLTLNLGLRYELYPLVSRDDRPLEFMDVNTLEVILDNDIEISKNLFAPRVGFAYRLTDKDVLRSGYGITFDPLPFARPLRGFYPLTFVANFEGDKSFLPFRTLEEGIPIFIGPSTDQGTRLPLPTFAAQRTMPPDKIHRGYIQSWNMVYERKLPQDFVISAGYVGTQTVHQLADRNLNYSLPGGGNQGRQLFPYTNDILFWDGWLSANYHSLQVAINRRFTDGLFVKGAYTYSKAISMTDEDGWGGLLWNDPAILDRNRAQAGYNIPHMLQLATVYELPFGRSGDSFAHHLIRGWQVNGIFSVNENRPFRVSSGGPLNARENVQTADQVKAEVKTLGGIGRGNPYYDREAFAPVNRVPGEDCTHLDCYGNSGRNILRGPTWVNLDFSVFRHFEITEAVGLEFRSEFFNLTNTPHFNNPNGSVTSSNFFVISSTSNNAPERYIRFGFKLTF